jgi:hypothetical protein
MAEKTNGIGIAERPAIQQLDEPPTDVLEKLMK